MVNEQELVTLIAMDRLDMPLSSLDSKLRRRRLSLAKGVAESMGNASYAETRRTHASVEYEDKHLARGMKEAIAEFVEEFPKQGEVLKEKVREKRMSREKHLYFEMNPGTHLSGDDYLTVLKDLGLSEHRAHVLYPSLMEISNSLAAESNKQRSAIVGRYDSN